MKNLFAFVIVAGMVTLASCGGAEEAAKKMQDSINMADSTARVQKTADSIKMNDSINKATQQAAMDAANKHMADSIAMAAHDDSVKKHLIKAPKK